MPNESCKLTLGSPGIYFKKSQNVSLKRSQLTLSQGILTMGDDDEKINDEVRTTGPALNYAKATRNTEEPFLCSQ